jgi:hypothetical protein
MDDRSACNKNDLYFSMDLTLPAFLSVFPSVWFLIFFKFIFCSFCLCVIWERLIFLLTSVLCIWSFLALVFRNVCVSSYLLVTSVRDLTKIKLQILLLVWIGVVNLSFVPQTVLKCTGTSTYAVKLQTFWPNKCYECGVWITLCKILITEASRNKVL